LLAKCTTARLTLFVSKHHTKKKKKLGERGGVDPLILHTSARDGSTWCGKRGGGSALQLGATKGQFGRFREEKNIFPFRNVRSVLK
jgi:hypothetical protein